MFGCLSLYSPWGLNESKQDWATFTFTYCQPWTVGLINQQETDRDQWDERRWLSLSSPLSVSHPQHSQQTRAWKRQEGHCPKADHTERMQTSLLPLQALLPSCQQERRNSALKMRSYLKQTDFQKRRVTGVLRNPPQRWSRASATQRLVQLTTVTGGKWSFMVTPGQTKPTKESSYKRGCMLGRHTKSCQDLTIWGPQKWLFHRIRTNNTWIFEKHFITKISQHTTKLKEFYVEYSYAYHSVAMINILLSCLLYVYSFLNIHSWIHFTCLTHFKLNL